MKTAAITFGLALALSTFNVHAQNGGNAQGGEHKRPIPPIIAALDANGDGVIDADEIANASAALKKLDKNGDGKLTRDEIMPAHMQGKGNNGGDTKPPAEK